MTIQKKIDGLVNERALLLSSLASLKESLDPAFEEKEFIFDRISNDSSHPGVLDILSLMAQELNQWADISFNKPDIATKPQSVYSYALMNKLEAVAKNDDNDIFLSVSPSELNKNSGWILDNGIGDEEFVDSQLNSYFDQILTGLEDLRLARAEINPADPPNPLNPDYYSDPEKSAIESGILNVLSKLDNIMSIVLTLEEEILNIPFNSILSNPSHVSDNTSSYIGFLTDLGDRITDFENAQLFLETKAPGGNYSRSEFNSFIAEDGVLETYIFDLKVQIHARIFHLRGQFSSIAPNSLRAWYIFWMEMMIGKPQASLISYMGLQTAIDSAKQALDAKWEQLNVLFGDDYDKYLPTPRINAIYKNDQGDIVLLLNTLPCFDNYKVYFTEVDDNYIPSNVPNEGTSIHQMYLSQNGVTIVDESGSVENSIFVYRVSIQDNSIDSHYSGSQQSPVIGEVWPFVVEDPRTLVLGNHTISGGQNIYIAGVGLLKVISRTSVSITVDKDVHSNGDLTTLEGLIFT